jgi:hypothetical protein
MPTLADIYPAYALRSPAIGVQGGTGGMPTGLPVGALAALMRQRPGSGSSGGAPLQPALAAYDATVAPRLPAGPTDLDRAAASIARIESAGSGNYGALGPVTRAGDRAYGRYQVMGTNVGPWTLQWYGQRLTPQEFLASPEAQDAVFRGQFGSYLSRYGSPSDAASMWFTGRPYAAGATLSDAIPGVYPGITGQQYVSRFLAGL